jgi:transcriptional regulator with XRE-family HTH domain
MYKRGMVHLSDYMAERGLSDEEVGKAIDRDRVTVSRIRRRKVRPDWTTIEKLKTFSGGQITADDFAELQQGIA